MLNFISFTNLDDYLRFSKPMNQKMQTLYQKKCLHWNDDQLDFILINLLETYSNASLKDILQLFNSLCNTNLNRKQVHDHIPYMQKEI
jgi:hypothetical protein